MPKERNISKETLIDLYLIQKLSTNTIAKSLSCKSHVTILNYLKKYNITRRSKLGNRISIQISKKTLYKLYHKEKLTQKQIAKNFGNKSAEGIRRLMRKYSIKARSHSQIHTKYPKFNFSGVLQEKAYLIGFRLGDLNVYKVHELIQIRCSSTIQEQADLFKKLFDKYGYVHITTAKRGTIEMVILLNKSFDFLLPKRDLIENWILENDEYFLAFLAGYTDAEGSYYLRKPYYKKAQCGWGIFEVQSYDKGILAEISRQLYVKKIKHAFYQTKGRRVYKKDLWKISINCKQSLWDFIKLIEPYHQHKNKLIKLKEVKNNIILRNSLPYCRPISF